MCVIAAALAVTAIGGVLSAVGAQQAAGAAAAQAEASGRAAQSQADYNARLAEQRATQAEEAGRAEENRFVDQAAYVRSGQRAEFGASGVTMDGSPLEALAATAAQQELDRLTMRYNTQVRASDLRAGAAAERFQGQIAMTSAQNTAAVQRADGQRRLVSGLIETGGSLLTRSVQMAPGWWK